jgi:glucose-6-phosphate isomerase
MSDTPTDYRLTGTRAYARLRTLAKRPYDLTAAGALTPARLAGMRAGACGFSLLYATERVDEEVLAALIDLAAETRAREQLRALMAGAVMNRIEGYESEQRRVLHGASRNVFSDLPDPMDTRAAADAEANARRELDKLKAFMTRVEGGALVNARGEPFTDLVNIGIGGSDLGPRALYLALQPFRQGGRRVHFISNVDPDDAAQVLGGLELSRTLVNVVSKSGSTLETLTNETLAREAYARAGLEAERHFLCVTGEGSPMDNPARYLASFYMFDYIGGRYSATSMVGGVCLAFGLGAANFVEVLRGAREMDLHALEAEPMANLPLLAALLGIWNRNLLGLPTLAVLPYSQGLIRFAAHLQQLDMESNGKRIDRRGETLDHDTGPIVWGEPGTNGQHAFYQLIHQSRTVIPCEFIGFRRSQYGEELEVQGTTSQQKLLANLLAQSVGLACGQASDNPNKVFPGNRPNSVLIGERLTPRSLGALLAYYENKVTFQGLIWNINSFDQEGVQLGKVLANRYLDHFKALNQGQAPPGDGGDDPLGWALFSAAGLG